MREVDREVNMVCGFELDICGTPDVPVLPETLPASLHDPFLSLHLDHLNHLEQLDPFHLVSDSSAVGHSSPKSHCSQHAFIPYKLLDCSVVLKGKKAIGHNITSSCLRACMCMSLFYDRLFHTT